MAPSNMEGNFFWLSYADEDGFRGCVLTRAKHLDDAIRQCHQKGINPGGQVLSFEMDQTMTAVVAAKLDAKWIDKLLPREEGEELDTLIRSIIEDDDYDANKGLTGPHDQEQE